MPTRLVAGRYEIRELLGEGGMGVVYRAIDTRTGGLVAIKTMRDISDPRTVEMFKREWRVLARLSHPNIVDIRDVDEMEEDGVRKPCFVMPLLPGITLASLIKEGSRRLTVEKIVGMLCQVCNGLESAHKAGLIHRDLKPSNIFIMEDDTAKLIDFGLVYAADAHSVTGYKGTWQYMAPEQTEGKTPSICSDIFSLGVVAYETFTARKPFARSSVEATVQAIRSSNPPAISEINPKVSQLLSKVVHKAMAKLPVHRYATAREFAETLQKAYQNRPIDRFETARILPRIERARKAFAKDDPAFASEILTELEAEGNVDPEISLLRAQIEEAVKQKRIRQLFESAQTRVEQDEIPLALDKLREVLELDPENAEALAMRRRIEVQRSSEQISNWLKLARQHSQLQDFGEARQALKEVLNIRYDDGDALQLLAEVDVAEKEAIKARAEKEQLYGSALKAYQGGEISTALSKLEKILEVSRRIPGATIPERDAVYQSFYNRVRSERDSMDKAYEDGRRFLNEKEFQKALEICNGMLTQYPASAQFQALKLKAEQAERQELSAYIAEIGKASDAEPDLNRRVNILEEACRRYPNEVQFQQSLRLTREQRDLVHSISAKARQYEEQSQFADAVGQWKILRNIHPQYPGIEVEIGHLEKRREQQIQEEKKARFVEQIDQAIDHASFARALALAGDALAEFPQDSELVVLEKIARQGLERTGEAERLFEEARKMRAAGKLEDATALLQQALKLDERSSGLRNALVNLLVERAHALLDADWGRAEPLAQAALELDVNHPAVKRLCTLIAEAKRKDCVAQCVTQVRQLQGSGDVPAALSRLEDGLSQYPDEPRLIQYRASLQNTAQRKTPKPSEISAAPKKGKENVLPPFDRTTPPLAASAAAGLTGLYDARSEPFANSIPNSVRTTVDPILTPDVVTPNQSVRPAVVERDEHKNAPPAIPPSEGSRASVPPSKKTSIVQVARTIPKLWAYAVAAAVLICVITLLFNGRKPPRRPSRPITTAVAFPVILQPPDATLTVDGVATADRTLHLLANKTYNLTASKLGYKSASKNGTSPTTSGWTVTLQPEPVHLQVLTPERTGSVLLDGREIWNLEQGDMLDATLPADAAQHTLLVRHGIGELFNVAFSTAPGQSPKLSPLTAKELTASCSLGSDVTVLSGNPAKSYLELPGGLPVELNQQGTTVNVAGTDPDGTVATISDGSGRRSFFLVHGNAPTLVLSSTINPNLGSATITTPVESAKLFIEGREKRTRKPGFWHFPANIGPHEIRLTAEGYADEVRTLAIVKGQDTNLVIQLTPASSSLTVDGGTTGAEILVDDAVVGSIEASGSLRASVPPGTHRISVRKTGFESIFLERNFAPGQPLALRANDVTLKPFGTIDFSIQPSNAAVQYRRSDENEWHDGAVSGSIKVKAGAYEVTATAPGYSTDRRELNINSGAVVSADLHLPVLVVPKPPVKAKSTREFFLSPDDLQEQPNKWFTGNSGKLLTLKPAAAYHLVFLAPEAMPTRHKPKRFEWHMVAGPNAEAAYELDGQQLTRKVKINGKTVKSSVKVNASEGASAFAVVVTAQAHVLRVAKENGTILDEFTDGDNDWSRAAVAIKGDAFFVVR